MDDATIMQNTTKVSPNEFYTVEPDGIYGHWTNGIVMKKALIIPKETFVAAYKTYILDFTESNHCSI